MQNLPTNAIALSGCCARPAEQRRQVCSRVTLPHTGRATRISTTARDVQNKRVESHDRHASLFQPPPQDTGNLYCESLTLRARRRPFVFFFFNDPATTEIYTLSLHDALPI